MFKISNSNPTSNNLAVIMSPQFDGEGVFSKNKGYFQACKQRLIDNNYQAIEIDNVRDPKELKDRLGSVNLIDFFWLRAHGSPKAMQFSSTPTNTVQSEAIIEQFDWLPDLLSENAIIFLDSCNTGNIDKDFYNNIQFSFAKLTLAKPNVTIVAPSKISHLSFFEIDNNEFRFFSNYGYGNKNDIVVLSSATKELLSNLSSKDEKILEYSRQLLISTLITDNKEILFYDSLYYEYLIPCNLMVNLALKKAILANDMNAIKELLEKFKVDVNRPLDLAEGDYFPLCWAIASKSIDILKELLQRGANIFESYKGISPFNYLLQKSYDSGEVFYFKAWSVFEGYLKQQQPSDLGKFYSMREKYRLEQSYNFTHRAMLK